MSYSRESPFANCLSGAPGGDYLSRAIVGGRGAPTADTAFMGLTSCRQITITSNVATPSGAGSPSTATSSSSQGPDGLVFPAPKGGRARSCNYRRNLCDPAGGFLLLVAG